MVTAFCVILAKKGRCGRGLKKTVNTIWIINVFGDRKTKSIEICIGNKRTVSKSPRITNHFMDSQKTCSSCKIAKPITAFYKNSTTFDRLRSNCKTCHNTRKTRAHARFIGNVPEYEKNLLVHKLN
jgi:hypothetical protein